MQDPAPHALKLKGAVPAPTAIGCQVPEVQNGKVHNVQSAYRAGETLHFDCHPGYAAEGSDEARCQPGGIWDPPLLVCHRGECCSASGAAGRDLTPPCPSPCLPSPRSPFSRWVQFPISLSQSGRARCLRRSPMEITTAGTKRFLRLECLYGTPAMLAITWLETLL